MRPRHLFSLQSREQAIGLQTEMSELVIQEAPTGFRPRLICGLDVAYRDNRGFSSAVLWDLAADRIAATAGSSGPVKADYVPGFLGFREGLLMVSAAKTLRARADAFLVDGHGRAHPRRFGLACHVGLALDKPTVGVGKSSFYGRVVGENILAPDDEVLGRIVRAKSGKTYYVSVGHRVGLNDAVRLVRDCMVGNHPAPLREAHLEAVRLRRTR